MSKQSKIFGPRNTFEICVASKARSHTGAPNSAEKGESFFDKDVKNKNTKGTKKKSENEFYLSYRDQQQKDNFSGFYRMKSLMFAVSHLTAAQLRGFKVMGIMDKKIVVAFHQKLQIFCFFDQHAMHQRIRYEYYLECLSAYDIKDFKRKDWKKSIIQKTGKEVSVISSIKHSYMSFRLDKDLDDLIQDDIFTTKYGFEIEYLKVNMTLKVKKVPTILERAIDNKLVLGIAHDIISNKKHLPKCFQSIIAQISCKSAFKFNDIIDTEIIEEMIRNLSLCQYPFFCVHGRPTLFTRI